MDNFGKPSPRPQRPIAPNNLDGAGVSPVDMSSANVPSVSAPQRGAPEQPRAESPALEPQKNQKKRRAFVRWGIIGGVLAIVLCAGALGVWYGMQLRPVNSGDTNAVTVTIESGQGPGDIARTLKQQGLIRSELGFMVQTRIQGVQGLLQAGAYRLAPSDSLRSIISHLTDGKTDTFELTFLPGAIEAEHKKVMTAAGMSKEDVDAAFAATYTSPLFRGKPKDTSLEGYIYGDTYQFDADASAKEVLEKVFAEFFDAVQKYKLEEGFKAHGLTLYQGITLASIIQREAAGGDEAQIAQVFQKRLATKVPLGSDVTYQYIADKMGVKRDVNLDSPYNTRRYTGLPPGPISSPGLAALKAVAQPAKGDYLYFLSGDDDVTYFSKTAEGHEENIKKHCQQKCQII